MKCIIIIICTSHEDFKYNIFNITIITFFLSIYILVYNMWTVVCFETDNTVDVVSDFWYKNGFCE